MPGAARSRLQFRPEALAEWNGLDGSVKEVLRKLLKKRLEQPRLPPGLRMRWLMRVVLPEPRKPVRIVTGTRPQAFSPEKSLFLSIIVSPPEWEEKQDSCHVPRRRQVEAGTRA